jgi:membrane-associated phospholipid phosphatase
MLIWLGLFYYGPQWFPIRAPYELVPSFLDQEIPFLPQTAWIYQSLFFLLPLATFVQPDRENLIRFASGFCLLVLTFSMIFWLFPTELQAPVPIAHLSWGYEHLVAAVDGRRNAFPSLHAALTVYAGFSIIRLFQRRELGCALMIFWIVALLISTLTTKQHIYLDLLAGATAGFVASRLALASSGIAKCLGNA